MTDLSHLFDSPECLALYRVKRERDELRVAIGILIGNADDATDDAMLVRRSDVRRLRAIVGAKGQS